MQRCGVLSVRSFKRLGAAQEWDVVYLHSLAGHVRHIRHKTCMLGHVDLVLPSDKSS